MKKICKTCGLEKDIVDYYKHCGSCKECVKLRVKNNRIRNIEKYREYDRNRPNKIERNEKQKQRIKSLKETDPEKYANLTYRKANAHRKNNPEKALAWGRLNDAIRYGKIVKPNECVLCKIKCNPEAHHSDYSKPYDVMWLCSRCHHDLHKRIRNEKR